MIINKLVLTNFGVFHGRHEFELKPRTRYGAQRPIVLIGGKNGSGKTTILEALRLCLYGRSALSKRTSTKEYNDYLSNLIHRAPQMLIDPDHAQIELEFDYATNGIRETFNVQRSWQRIGSGLNENLIVSRNGVPISDLESEYWQEFIKDLIPQGIVQLFFFDGELIQQLAYGDKDDAKLAESLMKLLGLDLIEQLHADLAIYQQRYKKSKQGSEIKSQLDVLEEKKLDLENSISQLKQDLAQKTVQIEQLSSIVSNLDEKLRIQGGEWVRDRNQLTIQKEKLLTEMASVQNEIREQCGGLFPFTLVTDLCQSLKVQLESEQQLQKQNALTEELNVLIDKARAQSRKLLKKFPQISKPAWDECIDTFVTTLSVGVSKESKDIKIIHDVSISEQSQMTFWINEVLSVIPKKMQDLSVRLEKITRNLQLTEANLQRIPPEESIQPIVEEISAKNKALGALQHEESLLEKERNNLDSQLEEIKRATQRLFDSIDKNENMEERLLLSSKVQIVLKDFVLDVKARKVRDLENCFSFAFSKLARKSDLVKSIKINPETFAVSLFNERGREIPRKDLSAGEKQIYAISMLWALGQISGRPLPVVIDTPLGRLDSDHRAHIVENYFPKASHQVVLLSTDTEIERSYFKFLGPYISHAYQLDYDSSEGTTKLQEGYFWSAKESVVAS